LLLKLVADPDGLGTADGRERATQTVLEQAEVLSEGWAVA
jgi:hypothetical protein